MFWPLLAFLAAVAIRAAQALVDALPYLPIGCLLAGLVPTFGGSERFRRAFVGPVRGPVVAAALAAVLPVCSLAAIPLLTALRRTDMPRGAWLTLALSVGILNPFSLAYGLTLLEPHLLAGLALASLMPAVAAGLLVPASSQPQSPALPPIPPGPRRLAAVAWLGARELAGPALPWIGLALLGAGLTGALVPHAGLDMAILADDPAAPLRMMAIAPTAQINPERAVMLSSQSFLHSGSAGVNYLIFALGAGLNLGLIGLGLATLGPRPALRRIVPAAALALGLAYGFHASVPVHGLERGDTHAFDRLTNPFASAHDLRYLGSIARKELGTPPAAALAAVAILLTLGLAAHHEPTRRHVERALLRPTSSLPGTSLWSRPLPTRVVALGGLAAVLLAALALAFVYYPAPDETFDDMRIVRADAFSAVLSQTPPHALRILESWRDLNSRLMIGTLLRRGSLPEPQRLAAHELETSLDQLRQAVASGSSGDQTRHLTRVVDDAYSNLRRAYGRP